MLAAAELKANRVRCLRALYLGGGRNSHYSTELLRDADRVLEAKLYSYNRGSASLLEVLEAQRATTMSILPTMLP